jgi:hypothetical protein
MRRAVRTVLVAVALSLVVPTAVAGASTNEGTAAVAGGEQRRTDFGRGVRLEGLREAPAGSPCDGGFLLTGLEGPQACTHGPDPSPHGVDVRRAAPLVPTTKARPRATTWCDPDSPDDGARVQAVYAVASDRPDRYDTVVQSIRTWAAAVEQTFVNSADAHGAAPLHVRWVTTGNCQLDVRKVVVSPDGDGDFGTTIAELQAQGLDDANRKYLIWMDTTLLCGIGNMYFDDRPGQENYNNGDYAMYGRIDAGCWGLEPSVEAHELMHTLGAVQPTAPNSNGSGHCNDDADRMCYSESGQTTSAVCDNSWEALFDCGGDDYFNPAPKAGSYLADHWNTANSRFLTTTPGHDVEEPSEELSWRRSGRLTNRDPLHRRTLVVGDGPVTITVSGDQRDGRTWRVVVRDEGGTVVARRAGVRRAGVSFTADAGRYTVVVRDGRGAYSIRASYLA